MLNKKTYILVLRSIPLLILLVLSGYYAYSSWQKYNTHRLFTHALENVKNLQNYEQAIIDESLCVLLMDKTTNQDSCKKQSLKTDTFFNVLKKQEENLDNWMSQSKLFKVDINDETIKNFESVLGKKGINSMVKSYLDTVDFKTTVIEEKELLRFYRDLVDVSYATALEKFLVKYYVNTQVEIPPINLIYWDTIVQSTYMPRIEEERYIASIKKSLLTVSEDEVLRKVSSQIDDMRISILTGQMQKSTNSAEWDTFLEEKQKSLKKMKNIIEIKLNENISHRMDTTLYLFILFAFIAIIAFFSLVWNFRMFKVESKSNQALSVLLNKMNALSSYGTTESDVMQKMLATAKTKEDVYTYIYSSFQLLNEKHKQAKDEASSKSQFLSTLSHEIRTPLNGIIGFSKLLKDMGVSSDQDEFLSLIESSSHNLIAIVNDVLDLSKMNAEKMEIENVSFDIVKTIETTIAPFTQQTDQKDIELGLFIDPFLSQHFLGDATKLSQVLTNLVGNSIKFTEAYGKINIFVQCLRDSESEAQIKFAVHDDGIGLSQEQIENIFNAFSQATKATSKKYGGTGLGLTISRKMVELMGGKLDVESKEGNGATFFFTLSLKKDKKHAITPHPSFENVSVGLALPVKSIKRQLDTNLEIYVRHLGAEFSYYYYDDLFSDDVFVNLPDIMIFDHHYARLAGELDQCASIDCKTVLLTNGTLRSRVNPDRHYFDDIILTPVSLRKSIRILKNVLKSTMKNVEPVKIHTKIIEKIEPFTGLHALIADDNMINRKLIKIILEKIGLRVTLTSNGEEVSEAYKNGEFDIIFMDIQMPVMDGVDATHSILAYEAKMKKKHTPIIAVTANVGTLDKEHYLNEGMDDYATKPLEIETLKLMIAKYCGDVK
jgi:signal transduction histidine kinase/ActR/RegA family two-component response regulator